MNFKSIFASTLRLSLLTSALALCGHAASFTVNPVTLVKGIKHGFAGESKWHKAVYVAELVGATVSLGVDGGSTEYALSHGKTWEAQCSCYVQTAYEGDHLLTIRGTNLLDQVKIWTIKGGLAAAPFLLSYASHKLLPDQTWVDASLVGVIGVADFYYLRAGIDNLRIAAQIAATNKANGH